MTLLTKARALWVAVAASACAAGASPGVSLPESTLRSPNAEPSASAGVTAPHPAPPSPAASAGCGGADCPAAAGTVNQPERFPGAPFPPSDVPPPFDRSAQPGDGKWVRIGDSSRGERAADDPPIMYRTVIHPHAVSKWVKVTLVAVDLRHAVLHYVPGTEDVKDLGEDPEGLPVAPGIIPTSEQDHLLAVFNGGFKPRHGNWGIRIGSKVLVAPRESGCTVALYRDSTVRVGSWERLSADAADIESYRQTPPCLLEQGELHPDLEAHNERAWGGRDPKRKTRRRSAVGVDASGRVLLYALGEEAGPLHLALGLRFAGARSAAQLDINWSWTRFLVFGNPAPDGELQVTSTLIPQMVHRPTAYVSRHVGRDFFYVTRRAAE